MVEINSHDEQERLEEEKEKFQITEKIVDAFKLLDTNRHVAECYAYLLWKNECSLNDLRSQFHRKITNLETLKENKWVIEKDTTKGLIYKPISPDALLDNIIDRLDKEQRDLEEKLSIFKTAKRELQALYEKGITTYVLNTPEDFYSWQSEKCRNAKESIYAVTDRWMLALVRKDDLREAAKKGVKVKVVGRIVDETPKKSKELAKRAQELVDVGAQIKILTEKVRIRFMVIDEESVFFAIRKEGGLHRGTWIKSPDFAQNFVDEVNILWETSKEPDELLAKYLKIH